MSRILPYLTTVSAQISKHYPVSFGALSLCWHWRRRQIPGWTALHIAGDQALLLQGSIGPIDSLYLLHSCRIDLHLLEDGVVLLLVSKTLCLRASRVKERHSGPLDAFEYWGLNVS